MPARVSRFHLFSIDPTKLRCRKHPRVTCVCVGGGLLEGKLVTFSTKLLVVVGDDKWDQGMQTSVCASACPAQQAVDQPKSLVLPNS